MKFATAFAVAVALMLLFVVLTDHFVGLTPGTRDMGGHARAGHVWLVLAALTIVAGVDAAVVWLTFRRPRGEQLRPRGTEEAGR